MAPSALAANTFMVEATPCATNSWRRAMSSRDLGPGMFRYEKLLVIEASYVEQMDYSELS